MTMQTEAPLESMRLTPMNYTLDHFVGARERGHLELNAPYQRGEVWGIERQRNLIRSLIMGIPFGSIVVNSRAKASNYRDVTLAVIDGKQRITTLLAWIDGELSVPASWFHPQYIGATPLETEDGPYVTARMLTPHHSTSMVSVPTLEAVLPSIEDEQAVFSLINFGGVAQGDSDLEG
jgi:Protein of unknown function DUF262